MYQSFFSSGLVTFQSAEQATITSTSVRMRVHSQIWIAVFLSLVLAVVTMVAVSLVDRVGKTQRASKLVKWLCARFFL
jgi:ABC-type Fe3+ transport system permease subunit